MPILPDPYASSLPATKIVSQQQQADLGQLTGTITWSSQTSAEFAFSYQPAARGPQATLPNLLDISSNADQLGIFSLADLPELTIAELTLQAPGFKMGIFAAPEISCGRTAFEVVQIQSLIYPWVIKVVRTVTIERKALGGILRHDTGWQAASDGRYAFPNPASFDVHQGAVNAVVNVRNIRDAGPIFPANAAPNTATWRPVLFDADVELNGNIAINSGASGTDTVASRRVSAADRRHDMVNVESCLLTCLSEAAILATIP